MAKSTKSTALSRSLAKEIVSTFYQAIGDMRDSREMKLFLLDFMTDSERIMFAKRFAVALELEQGRSYEEIRKKFGVSSATISTVAEMLKTDGLQLALTKVRTEKWADQLSDRFLKLFS